MNNEITIVVREANISFFMPGELPTVSKDVIFQFTVPVTVRWETLRERVGSLLQMFEDDYYGEVLSNAMAVLHDDVGEAKREVKKTEKRLKKCNKKLESALEKHLGEKWNCKIQQQYECEYPF